MPSEEKLNLRSVITLWKNIFYYQALIDAIFGLLIMWHFFYIRGFLIANFQNINKCYFTAQFLVLWWKITVLLLTGTMAIRGPQLHTHTKYIFFCLIQ